MKTMQKLRTAIGVLSIAACSSQLAGQAISKAPVAPVIDGEIDPIWRQTDSWQLSIRADQVELDDLSATARVLWDDDNIYYLVEVTDDVLSDDSDEAQPWTDDSVEIYIDGGNEKATAYDANDAQITMRRTMRNQPGGTAVNYDGHFTWMVTETDTGYILEMAIAATGIPQTLAAGTQIGFEVQINDDDDGDGGDNTIKLFNPGSSWRNPSLLATATLVDVPVGPTIYAAVTSPTVDGTIDSVWDFVPAMPLSLNPDGFEADDLSATAKVLWDADNIYYLVTVMDDELFDDGDAAQPWTDDSVEIYVDGGNEKAESYDDNDAQITLRRTLSSDPGGKPDAYLDDMTYAVGEAEDGSGYALELSIPLTSLPQTIC